MKSKYETNILPNMEWIKAWCRDGLSDKEIARNVHVSYATFKEYKKQYPDFSAILRETKDYVDLVQMVGAYKKRAEGYYYDEIHTHYEFRTDQDGNITKVPVGETIVKKHVAGNVHAMENWLRLRQRMLWTDPICDEDSPSGGVILIPYIEDPTQKT